MTPEQAWRLGVDRLRSCILAEFHHPRGVTPQVVSMFQIPYEPDALGSGRPTWPETWMAITRVIAERSYDPRLKVGAIVVSADNTQMLAGGYNGNYAGGPHEHESPEPGQSGFIHAEVNALIKLDFNFPKAKHMYITHSPCRMCAKLIINTGIEKVVYGEAYRDPSGLELLAQAKVSVRSLEDAVRDAELVAQHFARSAEYDKAAKEAGL